jgi:hypothetical protein
MERREFLKIAFGFAAATTVTAIAATNAAEAAPMIPASRLDPAMGPQTAEPAIATDADVDAVAPEQVQWRRRRRVYFVRPRRRVFIVRRRRWRRW